jgi:hypothetical protein
VGVQSAINLHKPKKRVDGVSWSQNDAQKIMNNTHDCSSLKKSHHLLSCNILYDLQWGLHQSGKKTPKFQIPKESKKFPIFFKV